MEYDKLRLRPGDRIPATHFDLIADGLNREVRGPGAMHDARETVFCWAPPVAHRVRLVKVSNDGGAAGDASTDCTFTYSLYTLDGTTELATSVTPEVARLSATTYLAAATGGRSGYALAACDEDGNWLLLCLPGERPDNSAC